MGETTAHIPQLAVFESLVRLKDANAEKIATLNGEVGDRLKNLYDLHEDFTPEFWKIFWGVVKPFLRNELKGRERHRIAHLALDMALEYMDKHGHVGDIAELGKPQAAPKAATGKANGKAAPADGIPLDAAAKAFAKTAHKAPTPAESDAKVAKRKGGKPSATVAQLAATSAEGDAHIRSVAADLDQGRGTNGERARTAEPDEDIGSYRILS